MPAKSKSQRKAMAIAEHNPSKLYKRNAGLKKMSKAQLSHYSTTKEKGLPAKKGEEEEMSNPDVVAQVERYEEIKTEIKGFDFSIISLVRLKEWLDWYISAQAQSVEWAALRAKNK